MKFDALADPVTQRALRLDWLREQLRPVSGYGLRAFEALVPFRPGTETQAQQSACDIVRLAGETTVSRVNELRDRLADIPDLRDAVARAALGDLLNDTDFLQLQRFTDGYRDLCRVGAFLLAAPQIPDVAAVAQAIGPGRSGKTAFYLSDAFDPALGVARAAALLAQRQLDALRAALSERLGTLLGRPPVAEDEFVLMRDDVPDRMPSEVRILHEAPTYLLCAIEHDANMRSAMHRAQSASLRLSEIEEGVRRRLSDVVRQNAAALEGAMQRLGALDVLAAQVRFCIAYSCVAAEMEMGDVLAFDSARFLPLAHALEGGGQEYVPISLELRGIAVLSGPNMGGKTAALQTCGFIAALTAFGLPVPARQAHTALFDTIAWLGLTEPNDGETLLSSFGLEVVRLAEVLSRDTAAELLLADEFARTTTPAEGAALLVALIERLRETHRTALLATHLSGIASGAGVRHLAVRGLRGTPQSRRGDLRAALAALAQCMDYTIAEVAPDAHAPADALALAQLLGLDGTLIASARKALMRSVEG